MQNLPALHKRGRFSPYSHISWIFQSSTCIFMAFPLMFFSSF